MFLQRKISDWIICWKFLPRSYLCDEKLASNLHRNVATLMFPSVNKVLKHRNTTEFSFLLYKSWHSAISWKVLRAKNLLKFFFGMLMEFVLETKPICNFSDARWMKYLNLSHDNFYFTILVCIFKIFLIYKHCPLNIFIPLSYELLKALQVLLFLSTTWLSTTNLWQLWHLLCKTLFFKNI